MLNQDPARAGANDEADVRDHVLDKIPPLEGDEEVRGTGHHACDVGAVYVCCVCVWIWIDVCERERER